MLVSTYLSCSSVPSALVLEGGQPGTGRPVRDRDHPADVGQLQATLLAVDQVGEYPPVHPEPAGLRRLEGHHQRVAAAGLERGSGGVDGHQAVDPRKRRTSDDDAVSRTHTLGLQRHEADPADQGGVTTALHGDRRHPERHLRAVHDMPGGEVGWRTDVDESGIGPSRAPSGVEKLPVLPYEIRKLRVPRLTAAPDQHGDSDGERARHASPVELVRSEPTGTSYVRSQPEQCRLQKIGPYAATSVGVQYLLIDPGGRTGPPPVSEGAGRRRSE